MSGIETGQAPRAKTSKKDSQFKRLQGMNSPQAQPGVKWVKLAKYTELTGDTASAVRARRKKGQWQEDVHSCVGPDGNIWVNLQEAQEWVQNQMKPH